MGIVGKLSQTFYMINEGIMYSSIFVNFLVTIIDINAYSTNPNMATVISKLLAFNPILWINSALGQAFGSAGVIVGGTAGLVATIGALLMKNQVLNLSQQSMSALQAIFIYLFLSFVLNSFTTLTLYVNLVLVPMIQSGQLLPYVSQPTALFVQDLGLMLNILSGMGMVLSVVYILIATGMWQEM